MSAKAYTDMLEKYRDVDEDEIMSGLSKDELARLENEIDREILEKTPNYDSCESESYTTATTTSDDSEPEAEPEKEPKPAEEEHTPGPRTRRSSRPEAFAKGKLDKTQLKPIHKSLQRQKSKDKHTFKLPALKKTMGGKTDKMVPGEEADTTLRDELLQAVKKRDNKKRTKRVNSSGLGRRLSSGVTRPRRNARVTRYRDGNEQQVDGAIVNRNFITNEMLGLRPKLRKVQVKEPKLVLPEELHGVSFNRITAGARRKEEEEDDDAEMDADPEPAISEPAISEDGDVSHASRSSAFGYDADVDVTPSDDSYALPGDDYEMEDENDHHKAMSESSEAASDGVTMASTASTSAESCDVFGELSINPNSVEEMVERVRENDPTLTEVNLNNIHDVPMERFEELAEAMEENTRVTTLMLANTGLTDRAAKALAAMLKKNNTLKKLNIESNFITGDGGRRIVSALRKNNCLTELSIDNQRHIFGAKVEHEMSKMLRDNTSLLKFGYQFTNPGPRMAASNILTKNMDVVRKKRVAEEKKRQHGGHSKRPALRRQPSSEWYRKERLRKLQDASKMLGLDPNSCGNKDVEKVLKNMNPEEVSLLERWFTSKLLGMVDSPPTVEEEKKKSEEKEPKKKEEPKSDRPSRSIQEKSEENLLRPPARSKRSKSPPASRDQLLDSIRKNNARLKKVKLRPFESPTRLGNTDSDVEIRPLPKERRNDPPTPPAKNERSNARQKPMETRSKSPDTRPKSPIVGPKTPEPRPKTPEVKTNKREVYSPEKPASPKPAQFKLRGIKSNYAETDRLKPKVSVARFGVSVKDKIAAAERDAKQSAPNSPRLSPTPRTPSPLPNGAKQNLSLERSLSKLGDLQLSQEKESKPTMIVKPTITRTEPSFDESCEPRRTRNRTPEVSSSEEMFTASDAETASHKSDGESRSGAKQRRSPSPETREWKEGEEYDSDEYEIVEIEVTDSEEEESEEKEALKPETPERNSLSPQPKKAESPRPRGDTRSPQFTRRSVSPSSSSTTSERDDEPFTSRYKSARAARLARNRPPPFTSGQDSPTSRRPAELRRGYAEERSTYEPSDSRIEKRGASPPQPLRRYNPLSPPTAPHSTSFNRSLSGNSNASTDSAKSSPRCMHPTPPTRPARSRQTEDDVEINPKAYSTIDSFFSFK